MERYDDDCASTPGGASTVKGPARGCLHHATTVRFLEQELEAVRRSTSLHHLGDEPQLPQVLPDHLNSVASRLLECDLQHLQGHSTDRRSTSLHHLGDETQLHHLGDETQLHHLGDETQLHQVPPGRLHTAASCFLEGDLQHLQGQTIDHRSTAACHLEDRLSLQVPLGRHLAPLALRYPPSGTPTPHASTEATTWTVHPIQIQDLVGHLGKDSCRTPRSSWGCQRDPNGRQ